MQRALPDVLAALSAELVSLADLAAALQTRVPVHACGEAEIEALQGLDRLTQTLACLAPFVAAVGAAAPRACGVRLDAALDRIWLSALARRLGGGPAAIEQEVRRCELFE